MWPFNRNQKTDNLTEKVSPKAVKEYYQAGGKQQTWVIWLLSIATFIITLLLVLGVFWAGRWVWQRFVDNDDDQGQPQTVQQQAGEEDAAQRQGGEAGGQPNQSGDSGQNTPAPAPTPQPNQSPPSTSPQQVPATGDTTLPATGPTSDE